MPISFKNRRLAQLPAEALRGPPRNRLEHLPRELIQKHVLSFLEPKEVGRLSRAPRSLHADCSYVLARVFSIREAIE